MKILFLLSGSIACYKACDLISRFIKAGHEVQTVTTRGAEKFVGAATLEGLTGRPNLSDLWAHGDQMAHIRLPEWADVVLFCPATANAINRLAAGLGDELAYSLFLTLDFTKPVFLAPAMNPRMLAHPATRDALHKLHSWGLRILPTAEGRLACGDLGPGKLLEPEAIFALVTGTASLPPWDAESPTPAAPSAHAHAVPARRLLLTAGGTEEPIDSVRVITNLSSGRTGAFLADALAAAGFAVTLLRSRRGTAANHPSVTQQTFRSKADLENLLRAELAARPYDGILHLAAISDFSVDSLRQAGRTYDAASAAAAKLDSAAPLELTLAPTTKILPHLKTWATASPSPPRVVAFKLTDAFPSPGGPDPARALLASGQADAVVHNTRDALDSPAGHPARLHLSGERIQFLDTKSDLASALAAFFAAP